MRINKYYLALLAMSILTACSRSEECWKHHEIATGCPQYDSQRIYFPAEDYHCGIEYEVIKDCQRIRSYINIFSDHFVPLPNNIYYAKVTLTIEGTQQTYLGRIFLGGQTLLLSPSCTNSILYALFHGKCCEISLEGGYHKTLHPSNFNKEWERTSPCIPYPNFF